jgi:hypothetical protein
MTRGREIWLEIETRRGLAVSKCCAMAVDGSAFEESTP